MELFLGAVAGLTSLAVWWRMGPYLIKQRIHAGKTLPYRVDKVSIIIPSRNEASTLPLLLDSLLALELPPFEIIVADDGSTDDTAKVASAYPVKIVTVAPRPEHWAGKNWACHSGAQEARGEWLLFTDADTIHTPDGLSLAMEYIKKQDAVLLSAPIYHQCGMWWEKLLGPFYCLLQFAFPFRSGPQSCNSLAVGQYLLFHADFYRRMGGHAAIFNELAEDVALARRTALYGGKFVLYSEPLCSAQMYNSFEQFVKGWTRLLRLGIKELPASAILFSLLPLIALNWFISAGAAAAQYLPLISTLICFLMVQQKLGRFSVAGLIVFPFSILLFLWIACTAFIKELRNHPVEWKGRIYYNTNTPAEKRA